MKVPDRWLSYKKSGKISGTRFVAFKVPLREGFNTNLSPGKSFTPEELRQSYPDIKLIIDFTYTRKYYDGQKEFEHHGIQYVKIGCRGHFVPKEEIFRKFVEVVDEFLENNPQNYLIGVHCTHGINRTGYFIVRYMTERLGYTSGEALKVFLESRGHAIERTNLIQHLHMISSQLSEKRKVEGHGCDSEVRRIAKKHAQSKAGKISKLKRSDPSTSVYRKS